MHVRGTTARLARLTMTVVLVLTGAAYRALARDLDRGRYEQVDAKVLRLRPEEYRNKRVALHTRFVHVSTRFLNYVVDSGFEPDEQLQVVVQPLGLPVMVEKDEEAGHAAEKMRLGAAVSIYGRIRRFRRSPELKTLPEYYLEAEHIEPCLQENERFLPGTGDGD